MLKVMAHVVYIAVSIFTCLETRQTRIGFWISGRFNTILPSWQLPDRLCGPAKLRCN